ncbi:UbiA family prenyltransferase [Streptomyces griseorubiginosus]|uniref:UbiA family prenyltransferase n=1 Tax=Streptomyces griseorubiginosus TaxID=67304 RepID=UPI0015E85916|nr:UbiA family prenyltransferase [Streptomyces griseorubiginosus]
MRTGRGSVRVRARAWAELLRLPALFTVPGDALAGAAAVSARPTPRTFLAIASSLCLYEAGMALNDWADRDVDAVERPHRPLPSGRVRPAAALGAACVLTGAGLSFAAWAGRPALTVAVPLAATVWAYDLALKNTRLGPAAMATARGLDLLLGASATASAGGAGAAQRRGDGDAGPLGGGGGAGLVDGGRGGAGPVGGGGGVRRVVGSFGSGRLAGAFGVTPDAVGESGGGGAGHKGDAVDAWVSAVADEARAASAVAPTPTAFRTVRQALPSAALLGAHTLALTTVSRKEAQGGSPVGPLAALATTAVLTRLVARPRSLSTDRTGEGRRHGEPPSLKHRTTTARSLPPGPLAPPPRPDSRLRLLDDPPAALRAALATAYAVTAARPYFHAVLNPSPPLTQRAVTGGIRATIPLQAALAARSGTKSATLTALLTTALAPLATRFARKVSVT